MVATPLLDATPLATAHASRGIGTAVAGMLEGFRALPPGDRPALMLTPDQPAPAGFRHTRIARPHWPLSRLRLPDPWPALAGERRVRRGAGRRVFHATHLDLIPPGPTVATCHDLVPLTFPRDYLRGPGRTAERAAYRRQLRRLRRADIIVAVSQETADDVTERLGVPPARVRVIGWAPPPAAEPVGDPPAGDYLLYSGSLEPHKNLPMLLDALGRLALRGNGADPGPRLLMTGTWSRRRLERLRAHAAQAGAADRVEWLGLVSSGRLAALRAGAVAVVVPSRKEGFGLPVLEAMAAGVPVLISDTPALGEVAGDAARRLPADDTDAWAQAIAELAADDSARDELATRGRARAATFSWERTARELRDVYAELT